MSVQLSVVNDENNLVGNNIVLGSPSVDVPVFIAALSREGTGQEAIGGSSRQHLGVQRRRSQQSFASVKLKDDALHEENVLHINSDAIKQTHIVLMGDTSALDATSSGGSSARQVSPFFGIQREFMSV